LFIFCFFVFSLAQAEDISEFKKRCRGCHKEILDEWDLADVKHYPYIEQKCESCHAAEHKKFTAEVEKPCLICHDLASDKIKKAHFSAELSGVDCFNCHYTHGASQKGLLKEFVHMPFTSGMCGVCHELTSEGKITAKSDIKKACLSCHGNLVAEGEDVVHAAYEMLECANCHNPHTSDQDKLLNKGVSEICFDCHDKNQAKKHPYDVVPSDKIILEKTNKVWLNSSNKVTCVSCHKPHASKISFLLKKPIDEDGLCYTCHSIQ
jgi:predicted CXXCH cytochrome family protein